MLYSTVNIARADWSSESGVVMYSNILSCIVFAGSIFIALALVLVHLKAGQIVWMDEGFKLIYGAFLEGSTLGAILVTGRSEWHLLIPPVVYFIRRLAFISALVWIHSFTGQILLQLGLTLVQLCIILDRRRKESTLYYRMEIVNEAMLVSLYYTMMGFGMYVLDGAAKHSVGILNIVLLFKLIGVNAISIIYTTGKRLILWCRYRFCYYTCVKNFKNKFYKK